MTTEAEPTATLPGERVSVVLGRDDDGDQYVAIAFPDGSTFLGTAPPETNAGEVLLMLAALSSGAAWQDDQPGGRALLGHGQ